MQEELKEIMKEEKAKVKKVSTRKLSTTIKLNQKISLQHINQTYVQDPPCTARNLNQVAIMYNV